MADYQELFEVDFGKDKDLALVRDSLQYLRTADYPAGTGFACAVARIVQNSCVDLMVAKF